MRLGVWLVRRARPGPMRRTVGRFVMRFVRGLVVRFARRAVRLMRLGRRRPVTIMMVGRPGMGFCLVHKDDGRSGGRHAHERGQTEEEGTTADLLRLGRGVHKASPKS